MDIIFISYKEPNAEENWQKLKSRFALAKRIHNVEGIHQAHIAAAEKSITNMFWVIDGDAQIVDDFNFNYRVDRQSMDVVHVFKSQNPINGLTYGYGGAKLLPKKLTLEMDITTVDMTTSISTKFKAVPIVSNITVFNTDPFNTWKSAFRECVKLASKTIKGQVDQETEDRLKIWCTVGEDKPYGEYAISGALTGRQYGLDYADDREKLSLINNWNWLENEFNKYRL